MRTIFLICSVLIKPQKDIFHILVVCFDASTLKNHDGDVYHLIINVIVAMISSSIYLLNKVPKSSVNLCFVVDRFFKVEIGARACCESVGNKPLKFHFKRLDRGTASGKSARIQSRHLGLKV